MTHRRTLAVSAGRPPRTPGAGVNAPLVTSTTHHHGGEAVYRRQLGTVDSEVSAFEEALGALEGGQALAFASGTAATSAVFDVVPTGSGIVVPDVCYYNSRVVAEEAGDDGRLRVSVVDTSDTEATCAAMDDLGDVALLWLETPSNPMLRVSDLAALTEAAHARGALVAVDSTFNTPFVLRPLEFGADVVVHSATKYIAGHSDALIGATVTRPGSDVGERLTRRRHRGGAMPGALEAFLALRGLRTLPLRMDAAQAGAAELAARLSQHPAVVEVRHLSLPDDPFHDRAAEQMDGYGAVLTFRLGDAAVAERVCESVRLIAHATSLGGVESLIERRARYAGDAAHGVPDDLVRLSVGVEHVEDLWADLSQAIGAARSA
ncbi:trans-sulfuration enzyme family protein [Mobilicoccus caccae]|uniref:Cystathionine gamma-synthase n=1 Tax=Mobilicoccus caccae TaxID=1859295 RepID=A0ABQ6IJU5_9MICO|nr:PLP-dependent transferase [Mobilicoccus caccae]GMA38198.1 cystathionine gamma-synthase [Mobilicoccus caccae]